MGGNASKDTRTADTNELHKQRFQQLHEELVHTVNPASVTGYLFSKNIVNIAGMRQLQAISDQVEGCERLTTLLHTTRHPHAFVELRMAIRNDPAYSQFEDKMKDLPLAVAGVSKVLHTSSDGKPVCGIAALGDELYLLRPKAKDQIEVYDINEFSLTRCLSVPGLQGLADLASCARHRCLYISDNVVKCVYKLELNGQACTQWPVGDAPHGLSVGVDTNVLVTCHEARTLKVLKSPRGEIIQTVVLQSDVVHPWYSVQVATSQYVVCHGQSLTDAVHRLCVVDADGKTLTTYGGERGSAAGQMYGPVRLTMDSDQLIFVVDVNNKRVLLLSPNLAPVCTVVSRGQAFKWWPYRLCIDINRRRLYVADCGELKDGKPTAGRLVVFAV